MAAAARGKTTNGLQPTLARDQARRFIKEVGEVRVREKVDVLERRAANSQLRNVENAYSYLRSLVRNDDGRAEVVEEPTPVRNLVAVPSTTAPVENTRLKGRFSKLKAELAAMDAERRQVWVDRALESLQTQRMLNSIITRRAAQGDVLHGVLGSAVVETYAIATYGPNWAYEDPGAAT